MLRFAPLLIVLAAVLVAGAVREAEAGLPVAESDLLPLVAVIDADTPLGDERIALSGWGRVERGEPRIEGGAQVVDIELVELELRGAAALGVVIVTEAPDRDSLGSIQSLQPEEPFPASSSIDLFVDIAMPQSAFGPLGFTNDTALRLVPREDGGEVALEAWPPLGVTYGLDPGDDETPCLPLTKDDANPDGIELCIIDLALEVAPQWPTYSVARGGPSGLHPADLFGVTPSEVSTTLQAPFLHLTCAGLGLSADGCDDGSDGSQDDVDAISFGDDLAGADQPDVGFSVVHGAQGLPGTGVAGQAACPPADPGLTPEPASDEFRSLLDGSNTLLLDGNGPVGACVAAFPLGLVEGFGVRDDLDALHSLDATHVDDDGDGMPERAIYFSLDAASPSLAAIGASPADLLRTFGGATPAVFATAAQLGLRAGDDIDGLCLRESGDGVFSGVDAVAFSLAVGSPTLGAIDAGPGDLLVPGAPPKVLVSAATLGLAEGDDLNALTCAALGVGGSGDADCDGETTSVDAALVLQLEAGLVTSLPCGDEADVNQDGLANSVDAALILQIVAGLLNVL